MSEIRSLRMNVEEANASELLLNLSESEDVNSKKHSTDVVMEETEPSEPQWLQQDEPIALWVKWRGKWHAGIKCARADWPLMSLRGKPTNDRKNYFVIYFPNTKTYTWSEMELVRPINELPDPIAYKSHNIGVKKANDLTAARRYIMQKLTLEMFYIVDQFNSEAVVEAAKDVAVWKEFAVEATGSKSYQDLGRMLVRLNSMIMERYIDPMWLGNSFSSWVQNCNAAVNAESVELLNEEFDSSIQWNKVKSTSDSSTQPMVLSEWKTWKQDITKWFSLSHRFKRGFNSDVQASRKSAKRETRRAKTTNYASEMESDTSPQGLSTTGNTNGMLSTQENGLVLWDASQVPNVTKKANGSARKSQQCNAFIDSKRRQCGRWATEGDVLCSVHSPSPFISKSKEKLLCRGVTIRGGRCKHRSLHKSLFCKKHRHQSQSQALVLYRKPERSLVQEEDDNSCVGYFSGSRYFPCKELARRNSLYCKQHLPIWLKGATNRKSRIISKKFYVHLLKSCSSREEKLNLHKASELYNKLFKRLLSKRNRVPMDVQIDSALSEASRDAGVGEFLFKIISNEKERLTSMWGFTEAASVVSESSNQLLAITNGEEAASAAVSESPNQLLAITNGEEAREEENWSFSGFACAICLDCVGKRELLETHVEERHGVKFVEKCVLLKCIPCGSNFGDKEQLLMHVQAQHPSEFKLTNNESSQEPDLQIVVASQNNESTMDVRKYACKLCSQRFKLLPELGRHHQAEHRGANPELSKLKKRLGAVSYMEKKIQGSKSEAAHCSHEVSKAKVEPNNLDILNAARSACCRLSLESSLKAKFGVLPKQIYLKAAKLCGENGVQVQWNQEGYICSRGCKPSKDKNLIHPLIPRQEINDRALIVLDMGEHSSKELEMVLCSDISFGREPVPIYCIVDEDVLSSEYDKPWDSFTYVTKSIHIPSMDIVKKSLQHSCDCRGSVCSPLTCDHVYLFGNDFEEARDIYGNSMMYRFPYDDNERLILEEGYPVYECNELCGCPRTCPNRVLQKGIQVKLEVFITESKGWGLRAGEDILRGTFVCEYIGEVLDQQETNKRRNKYGIEDCSYIHDIDIDANINVIGRLIEGESDYAIDGTTHGNISRFINHSCSPNLVAHHVIVESMESPLAHIGFYANADIAAGEEITRDYGEGNEHLCHCGATNCRGYMS